MAVMAMRMNHLNRDGDFFEDEEEFEQQQEDDSLHFFALFGGLLRRDVNERATILETLAKCAKTWVNKTDDICAQNLLKDHLPTVLRLSRNSPYKEMRDQLSKLLTELKEIGCDIPTVVFDAPSSFIPLTETVCYNNPDRSSVQALSQVQSLYEDTFLHEGRLSNIVQIMGQHPSYLAQFIRTHDLLMYGNGALPLHIRNYIAILASSRHKCSYLVTMQETEFLKNDGDPKWLNGIAQLPTKMINLLKVNKLLAHQPWFIKPDDMKELLTGRDSWSMSELVHALAIMAHFHSLAGFALGCGVNPEIDTKFGHNWESDGDTIPLHQLIYTNPALGIGNTPAHSDSDMTDSEPISPVTRSPVHPTLLTQSIIQHYIESHDFTKNNHTTSTTTTTASDSPTTMKRLADTIKEKLQTMANESSSSDEETNEQKETMFKKAASSAGMDSSKPKIPVPTPVSLVQYLEDPDYEHEDFTLSSAITLRARDYSWDDHGYPFLNTLYSEIGPMLDEKFKLAFQMTYRTVGQDKDVDTSPFRQAVWYYIHSIKGIRHDDYQYRKVNQVLEISFKTYVRMVACFPEKVAKYDFDNSMSGLASSEKVHVNIIAFEARLQAELIYALRAIMNYLK